MTIKDEILLKTPDALMNGEGMAEMIASCCPNIKDVWEIPLVDLDAILIAIRLASYGQGMDMSSTCTNCGADNEHTIDLRTVLDNLTPVKKYSDVNVLNNLAFKLRPQTYKDLNRAGLIGFEQEKLISVINNSDLSDEEKKAMFQDAFDKLTELNIATLVSCIESITTEEGVVVAEPLMIDDFLNHTDRSTYDKIKELIQSAVGANSLDPVEVECSECNTKYKIAVEFNQTSFFA